MSNANFTDSLDICDFAQQVLFSQRLQDKMVTCSHFTDTKKVLLKSAPAEPARESHLRLPTPSQKGAKAKFPTLRDLETMHGRATALHFFANHELLALELMALAILRFPEAPESFRIGIAKTMAEEQDHLRLYLDYMQQAGMDFGDLPLNRFFWDVLSPMKTPFDYVTGLSLTFEQANLDFSLHYQQLFQKVGDKESAAILQKVYEDEIGHVKHGLAWFRRWKDSSLSDWDAFQQALDLPLSPTRAKGQFYSIPARQACGLDSEFIRQLQFAQQSKGRPPDVYIFNPSFEDELAHGSHNYVARKPLQLFAEDYASMMALMSKGGDMVVVHQKPDIRWLELLAKIGFTTPEFLTVTELLASSRKVGHLIPWGKSPQLLRKFQTVEHYGQKQTQLTHPYDEERQSRTPLKELHSKVFASSLIEQLRAGLLTSSNELSEYSQDHALGVFYDLTAAEDAINQHFQLSGQYLVLKAPLGASGRNTIRLMQSPSPNELAWIKNILANQHAIVIEKWQQRYLDLSTQIHIRGIDQKDIKVHGITHMLTDWRGQYIGHHLGSRFSNLSPELKKFFADANVMKVLTSLGKQIGVALGKLGYHGPCGIDSYIYKDDQTAQLKLRPIVELNTRYTMGTVALLLQKKILHGTPSLWLHLNSKHRALLGYKKWEDFLTQQTSSHPISMNHQLIKDGIIPTNDPFTAKECLGVLFVGSAYHFGQKLLEAFFKLHEKSEGADSLDSSQTS